MITCSNAKCGRENEDHYKFCLGCGSPLSAKPAEPAPVSAANCTQCGSALTPGQRFCVSCGFAVASVTVNAGSNSVPTASAPNVTTDSQASLSDTPEATGVETPSDNVSDAAPAASAEAPAVVEATPEPSAPAAISPSADTSEVGRLVLINPDRSIGGTFLLQAGANLIGRTTGAELFANDEYISPEHAIITVQNKTAVVKDLGSVNGVFYRITEIEELQSGDYVRFGKSIFVFESVESFRKLVEGNEDGTSVSGGRPTNLWGRLARVSGPVGFNAASNAWVLSADETVIGRERGDIVLNDDNYVSGTHARIFRHEGRVFVEDLQSSNGTFKRIRGERAIGNLTQLMIGDRPYRLQIND